MAMMDGVRGTNYETQTNESYAILGRFVVEFEHLVFALRLILEGQIGSGPAGHRGVQVLTIELTAYPLGKAFNSFALLRTQGNERAGKAINLFRKEFEALNEIRNDLVHGTHFIGWASADQIDFSDPDIIRVKNRTGGVEPSGISISHSSMNAYLAKAQELTKIARAIGVHLILDKWEAQFDSSGKFKVE